MEWIIEEPVLYVMEKPSSSDSYETLLGVATLPRKYFLFSYLGILVATVNKAGSGSTEAQIEALAKQTYAEEGMALAALPTSQDRFRDCALVSNDRLCMEIPLGKAVQAGRINVAAWDEAIGRPVHRMTDRELNALLEATRKRHDPSKVIWDDRPEARFLPNIRATTLASRVVWA